MTTVNPHLARPPLLLGAPIGEARRVVVLVHGRPRPQRTSRGWAPPSSSGSSRAAIISLVRPEEIDLLTDVLAFG
jgi:hypothetical protein